MGARCQQVTALPPHGFAILLIYVCQTVLDQMHGAVIVKVKDVGSPVQVLAPVKAEPADVFLNGVDELNILLAGVGVIETQVADRPEVGVLLRQSEVQANGLGVADVQIPVRFRGEARDGDSAVSLCQVLGHHLADEVFFAAFLVRHARDFTCVCSANQAFSGE